MLNDKSQAHTHTQKQTYVLCNSIYMNILEESNGEGNGTPLQYPCLENPMDGGDWWATVHGVAKNLT